MIEESIPSRIESVDAAVELVKQHVDSLINSSPLLVRNYLKHLLGARGKYIRTWALIISAQNDEGFIHHNAVRAAAAIEILHLATLVHDDVIDVADIRRGIATLQKKFGKRTAVICGDYLLSLALKTIASVENRQRYVDLELSDYVARVCLGELRQNVNNGNLDITEYEYLKIIYGKTAALFEASFYAGAVFSGCDKSEFNVYKRLGRHIGMIFQLIDDCMDYETTVNVAKKPVQSDFEHNVITLPLIYALSGNKELKSRAKHGKLTKSELNSAVSEAGGLLYTRKVAKKYFGKALKEIELLNCSEKKKSDLTALLGKVYREF